MWEKALLTQENSRRGLDPAVEFAIGYMAALQTSMALLFACGYRPSGRDHHHSTFAGVIGVGEGDLSRAARALDQLRLGRHEAVYGSSLTVPEEQMRNLRASTALLMRETYERIQRERPSLAGSLAAPPSQ